MAGLVPLGFEQFPPLVNPILVPVTGRGMAQSTPEETQPVKPVLASGSDDRPPRDGSLEKLFKLTVETRRRLLELQDDSHPTPSQPPG